jgi:hypothetical protein
MRRVRRVCNMSKTVRHKCYAVRLDAANSAVHLAGLEQQDCNLSQIEVDEVFRFVRDVAAEVAADDAVPGRVVLLVELFLDVGGDVLLDIVLLECLRRAVDSILLHVFRHVRVLDDGLPVSHSGYVICQTKLRTQIFHQNFSQNTPM